MDQSIIYALLFLITAPIAAYLLSKITHDEKNLIQFYFPTLITVLFIASIVLFFVNLQYAFTTTYMAITLFTWLYIIKAKKPKK